MLCYIMLYNIQKRQVTMKVQITRPAPGSELANY